MIIVGNDHFSGKYISKLKEIGNEKTIRFFGAVYGKKVHELYQKCAMFVSPSYLEGTSPAILEAMGCGRCIIASDIPMNRFTLGKSGVFFQPGNPDDLKEKVEDFEIVERKIVELLLEWPNMIYSDLGKGEPDVNEFCTKLSPGVMFGHTGIYNDRDERYGKWQTVTQEPNTKGLIIDRD